MPQEVLPCKNTLKQLFFLVHGSLERQHLLEGKQSKISEALCAPQPSVLTTIAYTTLKSLREPANLLTAGFLLSHVFYPTSTLSCPLTVGVSGNALLLNRATGNHHLTTWEGGNPVKEVRIPQGVRDRLDYPDSSTHTAATSNRLLRSPRLPPADHFVPLSTHIKN